MQHIPLNIIEFWDWFLDNEHRYRDVTDARAAIEDLDNQVLEFGLFSWEIGAGKNKPFYLTISPNGEKGRLLLSQKIVAAAPPMRDWEFHPCKPPKDWDFTFEAFDRYMLRQTFDASNWDFLLEKNDDGNLEILLCPDNLQDLDPDDEMDAADLAITNILGEELIIHHLDAFEVVEGFEEEDAPLVRKLPALWGEFERALRV